MWCSIIMKFARIEAFLISPRIFVIEVIAELSTLYWHNHRKLWLSAFYNRFERKLQYFSTMVAIPCFLFTNLCQLIEYFVLLRVLLFSLIHFSRIIFWVVLSFKHVLCLGNPPLNKIGKFLWPHGLSLRKCHQEG